MLDIAFIRFRHRWSSRFHDWEFAVIDKENLEDGLVPEWWLDETTREFSWSEHYRGIDYSVVTEPPAEWLKEQICKLERKVKSQQELIFTYQKMLRQVTEASEVV